MNENGKWKAIWTIDRFKDPYGYIGRILKQGVNIDDLRSIIDRESYLGKSTIIGNLLLNSGCDEIWDLVIGDSANHFSNANCKLGVGNDNTSALATQTDLLGGSTKYVAMDVSYPTRASQVVTFRSTFASGDANFAWEEYVIKQDTSAICLNRKVEAKGTKSVGETWVLTLAITLS